jgi:hypothetical protein
MSIPFHAGDEAEKQKGHVVYHTHRNCHAAKRISTGIVYEKIGRKCDFCIYLEKEDQKRFK